MWLSSVIIISVSINTFELIVIHIPRAPSCFEIENIKIELIKDNEKVIIVEKYIQINNTYLKGREKILDIVSVSAIC